jgi:hypothetical protein
MGGLHHVRVYLSVFVGFVVDNYGLSLYCVWGFFMWIISSPVKCT